MILKILTRHRPSYQSLIEYILDGGKCTQVFTHNLRSDTVHGWTREFAENESFRRNARSDQVYLYHDILSFSANEDKGHFTDDILSDLAWKYMELRGHDGLYLGAVHRDTDHVHIHFCTSGLAYRTGKSFRITRTDLQSLKQELQAYHLRTYPELSESICDHGSGNGHNRWMRETRSAHKEVLQGVVAEAFRGASSQADFLARLRTAGFHHYERNGRVTGLCASNGTKFRFSRLGIDYGALPEDTREETVAFAEIRRIRQERESRDMEFERS